MGGALFFVVCYPLSLMAGKWEQRLKVRDRIQPDKAEEADAAKEAKA